MYSNTMNTAKGQGQFLKILKRTYYIYMCVIM